MNVRIFHFENEIVNEATYAPLHLVILLACIVSRDLPLFRSSKTSRRCNFLDRSPFTEHDRIRATINTFPCITRCQTVDITHPLLQTDIDILIEPVDKFPSITKSKIRIERSLPNFHLFDPTSLYPVKNLIVVDPLKKKKKSRIPTPIEIYGPS